MREDDYELLDMYWESIQPIFQKIPPGMDRIELTDALREYAQRVCDGRVDEDRDALVATFRNAGKEGLGKQLKEEIDIQGDTLRELLALGPKPDACLPK